MAENTGITYIRGDATAPQGKGVKVIAHVCDDLGGWGRGFVLALSRRRPEPEAAYRRWHRERAHNDFGLGAVQFVGSEGAPVRDEAIDVGLGRIAARARQLGASVHMPGIGCGLAGGVWSRVEPLISGRLTRCGIPVTVYDR